ncbi:50S ribosomal protein L23 [bacterium]|nr:50S ribosomal protein L23 [candidate division CSSED10-310 bacterium]
MMNPYKIIISPVMTEKTTAQKAESNTVTFKVHIDASKHDIREAVTRIFKVKVEDVRTIRLKGKPKRMGRFIGRRPHWKKAVVKLAQGEKIPYFEGA